MLPLGLAARLLAPADTPALLAALLDDPPWERRTARGLRRFESGTWRPADRLRLSQTAIQARPADTLLQFLFACNDTSPNPPTHPCPQMVR